MISLKSEEFFAYKRISTAQRARAERYNDPAQRGNFLFLGVPAVSSPGGALASLNVQTFSTFEAVNQKAFSLAGVASPACLFLSGAPL